MKDKKLEIQEKSLEKIIDELMRSLVLVSKQDEIFYIYFLLSCILEILDDKKYKEFIKECGVETPAFAHFNDEGLPVVSYTPEFKEFLKWFKKLNPLQVFNNLSKHEVLHLISLHPFRIAEYIKRKNLPLTQDTFEFLNVVADSIVNKHIDKTFIEEGKGVPPHPENLTFEELADKYLEKAKNKKKDKNQNKQCGFPIQVDSSSQNSQNQNNQSQCSQSQSSQSNQSQTSKKQKGGSSQGSKKSKKSQQSSESSGQSNQNNQDNQSQSSQSQKSSNQNNQSSQNSNQGSQFQSKSSLQEQINEAKRMLLDDLGVKSNPVKDILEKLVKELLKKNIDEIKRQAEQFKQEIINRINEVQKLIGSVPGEVTEIIKSWKTVEIELENEDEFMTEFHEVERLYISRNLVNPNLPVYRPFSGSKILLIVDTSGSIGYDEAEYFFGLIKDISTKYEVLVFEIDTEIKNEKPLKFSKFSDNSELVFKGRGGTSFKDLERLDNLLSFTEKEEIKKVILLTDGHVIEFPSFKPLQKSEWIGITTDIIPSDAPSWIKKWFHIKKLVKKGV